jgi:hypothetical protein
VLAHADRKDVQFVIDYQTVFAGTEGEDESFVKSADDIVVSFSAVSAVHILFKKEKEAR